MKTLKNLMGSILFLILLIFGCQTENSPQECSGEDAQYLETFYSEEFASIPCALQNIESTEKEVNLRIESQADLEKYFTCHEQLPEIDFDKYFILTGVYRHHQCALFDSQQILLCNNKITYKVSMQEQICAAAIPVFYVVAIEKKYSHFDIEFDVRFKD